MSVTANCQPIASFFSIVLCHIILGLLLLLFSLVTQVSAKDKEARSCENGGTAPVCCQRTPWYQSTVKMVEVHWPHLKARLKKNNCYHWINIKHYFWFISLVLIFRVSMTILQKLICWSWNFQFDALTIDLHLGSRIGNK